MGLFLERTKLYQGKITSGHQIMKTNIETEYQNEI